MKYFMDHCCSRKLARILALLSVDIVALTDLFPENTLDVDFLPKLREWDRILVTADKRIRTARLEATALMKSGVSAIILGPAFLKMQRWDQAKFLISHWREIDEFISQQNPGTIIRVQHTGKCTIVQPADFLSEMSEDQNAEPDDNMADAGLELAEFPNVLSGNLAEDITTINIVISPDWLWHDVRPSVTIDRPASEKKYIRDLRAAIRSEFPNATTSLFIKPDLTEISITFSAEYSLDDGSPERLQELEVIRAGIEVTADHVRHSDNWLVRRKRKPGK